MRQRLPAPEGWNWSKVKHEATFFTGWTPPTGEQELFDGDNLWANISDLGSKHLFDTAKRISDEAVRRSAIPLSVPGSVLFSFKLSIGQVSFAERAMYTNEAIATFPPQPGFNSRWAYWALPVFVPANAKENIYGAKLLNQELIRSADILVPPPEEQHRIATFLDEQTARIDALIAEKERLALRVKEYEQAEISKLLTEGLLGVDLEKTGNTFVPLAPPGWRVVAFKRAIRRMEQGWSPQCENRPAEDGEWGVLKVGCVNGTKFNPLENKALPPQMEPDISCVLQRGDVLVSRANTRELVGLAALVDDDLPNLLLCDKLYRLHLRNEWVLPEYAVLALRSNASRRQIELGASGASSSMQNISQDVIRELVVTLPPLGEQAAIVERSAVIRRNCSDLAVHVEAHISRLREYRSSLISAAVTGQIDVDSYADRAEKVTA